MTAKAEASAFEWPMERALTKPDDASTCLLLFARQTPSLLAVGGGIVAGAMLGGTAGAAIATIVAVTLVVALAGAGWFRVLVHAAEARRGRAVRARRRVRTLTDAGVPTWTLEQLTMLARTVAVASPRDAEAFDLEGLLDHYVALECEHHRVERSVAAVDVAPLARSLAAVGDERSVRYAVLARRLALVGVARARAAALADAIDTISELIHLIAQRAELAETGELETACLDACVEQLAAEDELERAIQSKQTPTVTLVSGDSWHRT
jgi:hypothetical protein